MSYQPNPNDPYRADIANDEARRRAQRLDNELQADPELAEGPASGGRIALYVAAIAIVLGAVFYGLNSSSVEHASTTPASRTAQTTPSTTPAAPPGMRDVTPKANTAPGTTTGAAPSRPSTPAPANSDMNKSAPPPADHAPAGK